MITPNPWWHWCLLPCLPQKVCRPWASWMISTVNTHLGDSRTCMAKAGVAEKPNPFTLIFNILLGGLEHDFYDFPYLGNVIIPTDFHSIIFQRGRRKTTNQILIQPRWKSWINRSGFRQHDPLIIQHVAVENPMFIDCPLKMVIVQLANGFCLPEVFMSNVGHPAPHAFDCICICQNAWPTNTKWPNHGSFTSWNPPVSWTCIETPLINDLL